MSQVCRICKTEKILAEFIFRKDSNKHRTECRECRTQENRDWRQKPKAEKEMLPEDKIRCKTCQQIKYETEFAIRSDTGLRRNQCIICRNEY